MSTISVQTTPSYPILIERGLLRKAGQTLLPLHPPCRAALLSDDTVFSLYGRAVMDSLKGAGYRPVRISLPAGETGKTWAVLGDLLERLAEEGLSRGDLLVVLGGGSACDVGGLAAALYHRGMDVAYLATTLLAGVDAAIGGKTAVDLPAGKNLAGVIRQPLAVLIDPDSLKTLPPSALADGMAEAIKTGVLAGEELWPLVAAPEPDYEAILCGCAAYKAAIVSQEAQDTGIRIFLNLGHTIGHAVERHSGYTLSHGRAVAIGLASMARAGAALGWCDSITAERIKTALKRRGLPLRYRCRPEELLPYLWSDKKRQGEELTVVLPQRIGCCTLRKMTKPQLRGCCERGCKSPREIHLKFVQGGSGRRRRRFGAARNRRRSRRDRRSGCLRRPGSRPAESLPRKAIYPPKSPKPTQIDREERLPCGTA
ncbi:MAG: 3-dehydroquinate synthase family protein [Angelakisella sp.]